jgi:hypothetical protein
MDTVGMLIFKRSWVVVLHGKNFEKPTTKSAKYATLIHYGEIKLDIIIWR